MRCYVVSKGSSRVKVIQVIEKYGWDCTFLCDTERQKFNLVNLGIDKGSIAVSGIRPKPNITGVSRARDYVCKKLMPKNKWSIWIDDNVTEITGLPFKYSCDIVDVQDTSRNWRKLFSKSVTQEDMKRYLEETIYEAENLGTIFSGFSTQENYFWRGGKWQHVGYCRTQFALYKNDRTTWFPFNTMMWEDGYKSIDVVARYGSILINRHLKPVKKQFEKGGIGSFERRLPYLQDNCSKIIELFPGLVKYCNKSGKQYGIESARNFHLVFAKRSKNTIDSWRKQNGYL